MPASLTLVRQAMAAVATVAGLDVACPDLARAADEAPRLQCLSMAQARDTMQTRKLVDPFQCMRETASRLPGEPLGARLCGLGEALLYEISLLRPDGHIVKILVDAVSGRPHPGRADK